MSVRAATIGGVLTCAALIVAGLLPSSALAGTSDLGMTGEVLESSGDERTVRFTLTNLGPDAVNLNSDGSVGIVIAPNFATILSESPPCSKEGPDGEEMPEPSRFCVKTATLGVGGTRAVDVRLRIQPGGFADPQISGGVTRYHEDGELEDPNPDNDATHLLFEDEPEPEPRADLSVSVSAPLGAVKPGIPTEYVATVTNHGPDPASAVQAAATLGEEVTLLGGLGPACSGLVSLSCSVGTLAVGESRSIQLVGIPRHPAVTTTETPTATTAAVKRDTAHADITVSALTPDPNPVNDIARSTTQIRARVANKRPKGKIRRGVRRSARERMPWGWFNEDGYWYGLNYLSRSRTGHAFGIGGWTVGTRMFQSQKKKRFGFWPELYMVAEYRVRIAALTQTGGATYSQVFPNGSGVGSGGSGLISGPFWKVKSRRVTGKTINWRPGQTSFAFRTPEQRYVLEVKFRYYRNRIGRDKVKETGWHHVDSAVSGRGY